MKLRLASLGKEPFAAELPLVYAQRPGDIELAACERCFSGRRRAEVTRASLLETYQDKLDLTAVPSLLSDQAFAFFLPSLMQAVLDGQDDCDSQLPDLGDVLTHHLLDLARSNGSSRRLAALLAMYTPEQLADVARFLKAMRDHEISKWAEAEPWAPAAEALSMYWKRYLPISEA